MTARHEEPAASEPLRDDLCAWYGTPPWTRPVQPVDRPATDPADTSADGQDYGQDAGPDAGADNLLPF
jgi:hypothetical protein